MRSGSYIYWDVAPWLFSWGPITIRWYGLMFAFAFLAGYGIMYQIFKTEGKSTHELDRLFLYLVIGTLTGARLGHCLLYAPVQYFSRPLDILKIWEGGLASHGGVVGILAAVFVYTRKHLDVACLWMLDRVAIAALLGAGLIRIGNLFNSEIIGLPTDVPWAFIFARVDEIPRHPVQLYEAALYGCIFVLLGFFYRRKEFRARTGMMTGVLLTLVFSGRFILEFFKTRQTSLSAEIMLSMGQILSLPMVVAGLILLVRSMDSGGPRPDAV